VFSPNLWKKIGRRSVLSFSRKTKNAPLFPKNDVTEPKASYSNNQLKTVNSLKVSFKASGNHGFRKPWNCSFTCYQHFNWF